MWMAWPPHGDARCGWGVRMPPAGGPSRALEHGQECHVGKTRHLNQPRGKIAGLTKFKMLNTWFCRLGG